MMFGEGSNKIEAVKAGQSKCRKVDGRYGTYCTVHRVLVIEGKRGRLFYLIKGGGIYAPYNYESRASRCRVNVIESVNVTV